jgi:hypothetical protein
MRFTLKRGVVAALVAMVAVLIGDDRFACSIRAGEQISRDKVIGAWQARQRRVRSLDFSWRGPTVQTKKFALIMSPRRDLAPGAEGTITFESEYRFVLDERDRIRYEEKGQAFIYESEVPVQRHLLRTVANNKQTTLFTYGSGRAGSCFIARTQPLKDSRILPITVIYRPFDAMVGLFEIEQLDLTERSAVHEGHSCLVLEQENYEVWVDPARDFLPLRIIELRDAVPVVEVVVTYRTHEDEWVPESWDKKVMLFGKGAIDDSLAASVVAFALNSQIPGDTFKLTIPAGTSIHDRIVEEREREEDMLREAKKKRPDLQGGSATVEDPQLATRSRSGVVMVALLVSAIIVAGAVLYAARRLLQG